MAKYLLEQKENLTPNWQSYADQLINFAVSNFGKVEAFNVTTMGEQDFDQ